MRTEKPPESWLYKAWDGDVLVDVIFRPVGQERHLEFARALRERMDWQAIRERTEDSPYARAFFTLIEELGIVERVS